MFQKVKRHLIWILPILLMVVIAPWTPWLDLKISGYFYNPIKGFSTAYIWQWCYEYATFPAFIVGGLATTLFILSFFFSQLKKWRAVLLVLSLSLGLGSELVVNGVKEFWGRPRPRQIVEFGGNQKYRPFYKPYIGNPLPGHSFPSGHATMGFFFFSVYVVGRRCRSKKIAYTGLALTLLLGSALSVTRIAQGGHFFSDVLTSAIVMWLVAVLLDRLFNDWWKLGAKNERVN